MCVNLKRISVAPWRSTGCDCYYRSQIYILLTQFVKPLPVVSFFNAGPYSHSKGQRKVLLDVRSLHDAFVPWGSNRNCALLYLGELCFCSLHDQRRDSKQHSTHFFDPVSGSSAICHVLLLNLSYPFREKSASGCSRWQQRNTKTCTVWLWQEGASIATFSVSMWFPNT